MASNKKIQALDDKSSTNDYIEKCSQIAAWLQHQAIAGAASKFGPLDVLISAGPATEDNYMSISFACDDITEMPNPKVPDNLVTILPGKHYNSETKTFTTCVHLQRVVEDDDEGDFWAYEYPGTPAACSELLADIMNFLIYDTVPKVFKDNGVVSLSTSPLN